MGIWPLPFSSSNPDWSTMQTLAYDWSVSRTAHNKAFVLVFNYELKH